MVTWHFCCFRLDVYIAKPSNDAPLVEPPHRPITFPWRGYPNSWMASNGKSYSNGWFGGTPILGTPHICSMLQLFVVTPHWLGITFPPKNHHMLAERQNKPWPPLSAKKPTLWFQVLSEREQEVLPTAGIPPVVSCGPRCSDCWLFVLKDSQDCGSTSLNYLWDRSDKDQLIWQVKPTSGFADRPSNSPFPPCPICLFMIVVSYVFYIFVPYIYIYMYIYITCLYIYKTCI